MRIVVAGGGVAGLSSALLLSRAGHRVTLVERDEVAVGEDWRDAFAWERKGIPHFHQPHAFIPRGRKLMRERLPDVYERLLSVGARERDVSRKLPGGERLPEDDDLVYFVARRELIEWALRYAVQADALVEVRAESRVVGLVGDPTDPRRVAGLQTGAGEVINADLVVDAMGRASRVPEWLAALGSPLVATETSPVGFVYYSRYYQMRDGQEFPDGPWLLSPRGDLGYLGYIVFDGDNRTFAIVLTVPVGERELRILRDPEAFSAAAESIPALASLVDPGFAEPITTVLPMGHLHNTLRRYSFDGRLVAGGVLPVADAYCHTNPAFALGISMALLHPAELVTALDDHGSDIEAVGRSYLEATLPEAEERFAWARDTDDARARLRDGEAIDYTRRDGCFPLFMLIATGATAPHDPDIFRKATRRIGFLDRTSVFDTDADLLRRVERLYAEVVANQIPPAGPSRDELLAMCRAAGTVGEVI